MPATPSAEDALPTSPPFKASSFSIARSLQCPSRLRQEFSHVVPTLPHDYYSIFMSACRKPPSPAFVAFRLTGALPISWISFWSFPWRLRSAQIPLVHFSPFIGNLHSFFPPVPNWPAPLSYSSCVMFTAQLSVTPLFSHQVLSSVWLSNPKPLPPSLLHFFP